MQRKIKKGKVLIFVAIFVVLSLYFASRSEAFNVFTSAQDETRINNEPINAVRELKDINLQMLEELKKMNELLARMSPAIASQPAAPVPLAPAPLIRANP